MRSGATSDTRILDVFISTTAGDLSAYRDAVHDALNNTGLFFSTSQKSMVAHDAQAETFCRDKAKAADIFVGLVGMRRGWEPDGDNAKRSITEIEHDVAKESGRRRYIWVTPENFLVPANLHEARPLLARQRAFRKRVMASGERIVSQQGFDSPKDLATAVVTHLLKEVVSSDLIKLLRPELGQQPITSAEDQKPAVAAALGQLAEDSDVDLLALAKNPHDVDIAELEAKLTARAERHAATGQEENKLSAEYWRHIGALAFLHNTQKALAAYEKATILDPEDSDGWSRVGQLQFRLGDIPIASESFDSLIAIGKRRGNQKVEAQGYIWKGWLYQSQGKLTEAEDGATHALRLADIAGWKAGAANAYGNLGLIHRARGELDKAEAMQLKSLTLNEELGSKDGMARVYGNLALVHRARGELDKAEEMQRKSLALNEEVGRKEGTAAAYGNLGLIHRDRGELDKAEEMQLKSLALNEEVGRKEGVANAYANLGLISQQRGELDKAEDMQRKALALNEELGRKEGMAQSHRNLAAIYDQRQNKSRVCEFLRKERDLWREMGLADKVADAEHWMKLKGCPDI